MEKIRVGITGYGNLGKGVEYALENADDMELAGIFSRRSPEQINPRTSVPVYSMQQAEQMKDDIDVMIVCGGSANDLPVQTAQLAAHFNLVDSFDTHAKIPEHFSNVNEISKNSGKISIISAGWDPGMFSLNRLYSQAILPNGSDYTFWGPGVSQGHSDAVRRIEGVLNAKQYTIPSEEALNRVRSGEQPQLTVREKHTRECFVVAEKGADLDRIENEIKSMPNYFADYDTTVHFISKDE
ncbi:MAG: diaminopimelate dehydrogenase, partial [Eubacterium sp.]|nr:diaminopimelate dehydrogenase [Eubacterium sp.]